jgi:hypothetical protein
LKTSSTASFSSTKHDISVRFSLSAPFPQTCVEIQPGHLQSVGFAFFFAEAEDNDRSKAALHDHFDQPEAVCFSLRSTPPAFHLLIALASIARVLQHYHGCVEIILSKLSLNKNPNQLTCKGK